MENIIRRFAGFLFLLFLAMGFSACQTQKHVSEYLNLATEEIVDLNEKNQYQLINSDGEVISRGTYVINEKEGSIEFTDNENKMQRIMQINTYKGRIYDDKKIFIKAERVKHGIRFYEDKQ